MKNPEVNGQGELLIGFLRPGEAIRLIFEKEPKGKVHVSVEGIALPGENSAFGERFDLNLRLLRDKGFGFAPTRALKQSETTGEGIQDQAWVEIQPIGEVMDISSPSIGFAHKVTEEAIAPSSFKYPDFRWSSEPPGRSSLVSFLQSAEKILRVEVEFKKIVLPDETLPILDEALRGLHKKNSNPWGKADPLEYFINLWRINRAGWEVVLRAALRSKSAPPAAQLERIGYEVFGCHCQVSTVPYSEKERNSGDFRQRYPEGWPFPSLFPLAETEIEKTSAGRLYNVDVPELPEEGVIIGTVEKQSVRMPTASRDRHSYIVGATGTGKSTLLHRMIIEDMQRDEGVILLDPHGDLYNEILASVPRRRRGDLIAIDPINPEKCPGLNILDIPEGSLKKRYTELLIGELINCFKQLWDAPEAFGPMFELYFRNAFYLLTYDKNEKHRIDDFEKIFMDREYREKLVATCDDEVTSGFWRDIAGKTSGETSLVNIAPYIISKLQPILKGAFLFPLFGAKSDDLQLGTRIDKKPILLVNLNKGVLGAAESRLLGVILMAKIMAAGLERSLNPRSQRPPVNVYVDEFQNFVTTGVASMVSEGRKFGLRLNLANQNLGQLRTEKGGANLLESVLGNVGNILLFRLGVLDAQTLKPFLNPFTEQDLQTLPNYHIMARLLTEEGPLRPFVMRTLPPISSTSSKKGKK